jgi:hypothetical protein
MPSQPIATWMTPCSSRRVHVLGTNRRRQTIGLIPSSHTLSCTTPFSSVGNRGDGGFRDGRFGGVIRPVYRPAPPRAPHGFLCSPEQAILVSVEHGLVINQAGITQLIPT